MHEATPRRSRPSSSPTATIAICALLAVLVWIVFTQTRHHEFINFDDDQYVYKNTNVVQGLTAANIAWVWTHSHAHLWHPLTTLSHMLDCQWFGLRPGPHHLMNVSLHTVGAVLLFLVFRQMTGSTWRSAFVAAIFAIHPMRVESVAWVAERKDVLSGVFFMLTLAAYIRYARHPNISSYCLLLLAYGCGVLSKATLVTVPAILLLLDYWPLARGRELRPWLRLIPEKLPLLALAAVSSIATLHAQRVTMPSFEELALGPRIKNAIVSVVVYVRQNFWPVDLGIFYPHPHNQLNLWLVVGCACAIVAVTVIAWLVRERYPYVLVGWFWFLILLFPVLGLTQAGLQGHADRFTYLPHIGLSVIVAWAAADISRSWRFRREALGAAAAAVVLALTALSWRQTGYWRDSISIWTHTLAVTTDNQIAEQDLAGALWDKGDRHGFTIHSRAAARIHWETVLKDYPFDNTAHDELGVLLVQSGRPREAIAHWQQSLESNPDDGNALNNLGWALATFPDTDIRDGNKAVAFAEKAVELSGGQSPVMLRTLAAAEAEKGDFTAATNAAERAIELARARQDDGLLQTLGYELSLYRAGTPYREALAQDY